MNDADLDFFEGEQWTPAQINRIRSLRIMSPPRRPRGEKPATTIRLQQLEIHNLARQIADLRNALDERRKKIAEQDVLLSEADTERERLQSRVAAQAVNVTYANERFRRQSEHLAFLEGYRAKSQEILTNVPADHPRGAGARNHGAYQDGAEAGQAEGSENLAGRPAPATRR